MTTVTEDDLRELKDLINNGFKEVKQNIGELKQDIDELKQDINGLDKRLGIVEARLDEWKPSINKITDLAEKVGELKNWRQIVIIAITATISTIIGWTIRAGNLTP